jgi:hypothetical protein
MNTWIFNRKDYFEFEVPGLLIYSKKWLEDYF